MISKYQYYLRSGLIAGLTVIFTGCAADSPNEQATSETTAQTDQTETTIAGDDLTASSTSQAKNELKIPAEDQVEVEVDDTQPVSSSLAESSPQNTQEEMAQEDEMSVEPVTEDTASEDDSIVETGDDTTEDQDSELSSSTSWDSSATPTETWLRVDEEDANLKGDWTSSQVVKNFYGRGYHYATSNDPKQRAVFSLRDKIEVSGYYHVFAYWTPHANRATNAVAIIRSIDPRQEQNPKQNQSLRISQVSSDSEGNYIGTVFFARNQGLDRKAIENRYQKIVLRGAKDSKGYLIADGIALKWAGEAERHSYAQHSPITIDTDDYRHIRIFGDWQHSTAISGYEGKDYLHDRAGIDDSGKTEKKRIKYTPDFAEEGFYEIYVKYTVHPNRSMATYRIRSRSYDDQSMAANYTIHVNQSSNQGKDSDGWYKLQYNKKGVFHDRFFFKAGQDKKHGALILLRSNKASGYIIADAVKFVKVYP